MKLWKKRDVEERIWEWRLEKGKRGWNDVRKEKRKKKKEEKGEGEVNN